MESKQVISALESLHKELEKLEPAIKHVETAVEFTNIVKEIPEKHVKLIEEIKKDDASHKKELKEIFEKNLSSIAEENRKLEKTTLEIQKQVKLEQESLAVLKDKIQAFHEKIEKINFPERLDKIDANVAGLMAAVQSINSRLDIVERNLTDRLKEIRSEFKEANTSIINILNQSFTEISKNQLESQKAILGNIMSNAKKQKVLTLITWGVLFITMIIGFLLSMS